MAIVLPAGYNSYNVHLTETEHQTLIDATIFAQTTRALFLQRIISENLKLQQKLNELQVQKELTG